MSNAKNEYILEAKNIYKHFDGVYALKNVTLQLKRGEILGIVGDNGAGKSTLIKIVSGVLRKDSGEIIFNGKKIEPRNPLEAKMIGIETVYQDLLLAENLDTPSNVFLGREIKIGGIFLNKKKMLEESKKLIDKLGIDLKNPNTKMIYYSGGQRQAIAISKAVYWGTKVVILDEPTAALGVRESKIALDLIRNLKKHGLSIIVISHNMEHICDLVDRVLVLRKGQYIGVRNINEVTPKEIVSMITGAND